MDPQVILEPTNKSHRMLFIILTILLTAGIIGGTVYYVLNKQNKELEKQVKDLQNKDANKVEPKITNTEELTKEEDDKVKDLDETESWKTYTNKKYNFSIKYPNDWAVVENAKSNTDGSTYWGMNIFSEENVLFKNDTKQLAISINTDSTVGRGGTCVERMVRFKSSLSGGKLSLEKTSDETLSNLTENDMCGGMDLKGYSAGVDTFKKSNTEFFIHSENSSVNKGQSEEAIVLFEKILETTQFN